MSMCRQPLRAAAVGALLLVPSTLQAQMGGGCAMHRGVLGQGQGMPLIPLGMQLQMPGGMPPGMQMPQLALMSPQQPQAGVNPGLQTPQLRLGMPGAGFNMPPGP